MSQGSRDSDTFILRFLGLAWRTIDLGADPGAIPQRGLLDLQLALLLPIPDCLFLLLLLLFLPGQSLQETRVPAAIVLPHHIDLLLLLSFLVFRLLGLGRSRVTRRVVISAVVARMHRRSQVATLGWP